MRENTDQKKLRTWTLQFKLFCNKETATGSEKEYRRLHNHLKVCIREILVIGSERFLQVYLLYKIRQLDYLEKQHFPVFYVKMTREILFKITIYFDVISHHRQSE